MGLVSCLFIPLEYQFNQVSTHSLDAPIERVTGADIPTPYAEVLENLAFPQTETILKVARRALYRN